MELVDLILVIIIEVIWAILVFTADLIRKVLNSVIRLARRQRRQRRQGRQLP